MTDLRAGSDSVLLIDNSFHSLAGHNSSYVEEIGADMKRRTGASGDFTLLSHVGLDIGKVQIPNISIKPKFRVYHSVFLRSKTAFLPEKFRAILGLVSGNMEMFVQLVVTGFRRRSTLKKLVLLNSFPENVVGLALAVCFLTVIARIRFSKIVLCIHNGPDRKSSKLFLLAVKLLETAAEIAVIAHSPANTDLHGLAVELVTLPIPDLSHEPIEVPPNCRIVGVLGVSTIGKGFNIAARAVELALRDQRLERAEHATLHFLVQVFPIDSNDAVLDAARRLTELQDTHLVTFSGALERGEYLSVLQACDILVMAHKEDAYKTDLSGIFFEGRQLGKTLVASSTTAMGKEIAERTPETVFVDGDSRSLADTLLALARERPPSVRDLIRSAPPKDRWSSRSVGEIICAGSDRN